MTPARGTLGCAVPPRGGTSLRGSVCAVFRRSAHLQAGRVFISLGGPSLAAHPYTVSLPAFGGEHFVGQKFLLTSRGLSMEGGQHVSFTDMRVYTPSTETCPMAERGAVIRALESTLEQMAQLRSRGGFHEVLRHRRGIAGPAKSDRLSGQLLHFGFTQSRAVAEALRGKNWDILSDSAMALAGAGIGLTPAGDDFLAGVLAALRYHGRSLGDFANENLFEELARRAGKRTTPFSGFLLQCATRGLVAKPVSDWLKAVHTGLVEKAAKQTLSLAKLGHSSGLDTLCGMLLALQTVMGEHSWAD